MKSCFGYIRVSTQKQGEGVSLEAQKEAITVFASRNDLTISKWFEEKETAAKSGRPVFTNMLKQLKQGKAQGVIIHKIDRSARNLRDWAMFSELPDAGVSVYVATESLDFNSRGGRLTADIQAVIAADYIRNLREECVKGMNGRLKQGLYPWSAPPGYLNQGGGKPKIPCPKTAPLIKLAFELYATRQHSYNSLIDELHRRGLRNTRGGKLTLCGLGNILQNPFYIGLIRIKTSGQTYQGMHKAIVPVTTWKRVQAIRSQRCGPKVTRHNHLFQGLFRCGLCGRPMVPEHQKGHTYYRCKRQGCRTKTIREDTLEQAVTSELETLTLAARAKQAIVAADGDAELEQLAQQRRAINLQMNDTNRRLERLDNFLLDDVLDPGTYKVKKQSLQLELAELKASLQKLPTLDKIQSNTTKLAELRKSLVFLYKIANRAEKRMIIENVWPNRTVSGKEPAFKPYSWVERVDSEPTILGGTQERDSRRTAHHITENEMSMIEPLFQLLGSELKIKI